MIALDTNVLARYILQDDPDQSAAATALIEAQCTPEHPGRRPSDVAAHTRHLGRTTRDHAPTTPGLELPFNRRLRTRPRRWPLPQKPTSGPG